MNKINLKDGNVSGIYKITNIKNGKVYIGIATTTVNARLTQHINNKNAKSGMI